jgi:hypothetical protein
MKAEALGFQAIRPQRLTQLIGAVAVLALSAFGFSSAFRLFRTPAARAQGLPDMATPDASVSSMFVFNSGPPGSFVEAGTFTVRNNLKVTESIGSATISVSHPTLFSTMTLSVGGQSKTLTPPAAPSTFTFATPITVPGGGSVTFSLSAMIVLNPAMLGSEIKYAGLTLTASPPITWSTWPLAAGLLIVGIALLGLPDGLRRRAIIVGALALGLAVESAGCGSSVPSNKGLVASSDQQVTAVAVTAGGAPATVGGLPALLSAIAG